MRRALLLAALSFAGCRQSPPTPAETAAPLFREVAAETGLNFRHVTGATGEYYMPEIMGAGVALLDYDNDGDLDVYLIQGTPLDPKKKPLFPAPAGQPPGNRLFRSDLIPGGKLRFTDVTDTAGVGYTGCGMGVAAGDYDNDGYTDLYVTNFGHNVLYHNNGDGTFASVTRAAGVDDPRWSTSAAFLDYDRDGDLDLFVLNYVDFTVMGNKRCYAPTGEVDYCTPKTYRAVTSKLFRNDGNEKFTDVSVPSGITSAYGPGLGIAAADVNGDGWTDVYVANDTAANILWINQKNGTFKDDALMSGAAYSEYGLPKAGMGVGAGDFDNDGAEDLVVLNLRREGCTLFRNDGKGNFNDVTLQMGLSLVTFPYTGFGVDWFDFDNDGLLDLFMANGAVTIMESLRGDPYPYPQRNLLLHNEGEGKGFRDVTGRAGPAFERSDVSRGAAFGDIDNDGDVDIVVSNNNGPARLLLNASGFRHHWLEVKLQGTADNRIGIGARVAVLRQGQKTLWRRAHADSSYLSASDPLVHFGLGTSSAIEAVTVTWPNGTCDRYSGVSVNQQIVLRQGGGQKN